jgi:hypothetical protein
MGNAGQIMDAHASSIPHARVDPNELIMGGLLAPRFSPVSAQE